MDRPSRGFRPLLLAAALAAPGAPAQEPPAALIAETAAVPVRGGLAMQVRVYRPARPGRYPALYLAVPFPHGGTLPPASAQSGPVEWYVGQGYAVVMVSTRGTGNSQGDYAFLSREEQQDHYEIIEWIAAREWSDQKVAGAGAGYYATSQWLAALQHPPHLECIAPYNGVPDPYRDWAFRGALASGDFNAWYEREVRQANAFAVGGASRLVEYDLRFQQLLHPWYDEYWRLRSALEEVEDIDLPVFMMRGWNAGAPGINGALLAWERLRSPVKLLLADDTGGSLYASPEFHAREVLPFYEWCLKGESDTYVIRAGVRYQMVGQEQTRREAAWPPGNMEPSPLYLHASESEDNTRITGGLDFDQMENTTNAARSASVMGMSALRFATPPLARDLEIAGPLMLELYVSSTAADTAFETLLFEERVERQIAGPLAPLPSFRDPAAGGESLLTAAALHRVSEGRLKASARALDEEASRPGRPFHVFREAEPLRRGSVHRLDIALDPIAWRFRQGSRLILEIRPVEDGSLAGIRGVDTLHHGQQFPSRLWLPRLRPVNDTGASPFAAPEREAPEAPSLPGDAPPPGFLDPEGLFDSDNPVIFLRQSPPNVPGQSD